MTARRRFRHYIGIDYSGAATADKSLPGLRVYHATPDAAPVEVPPPPSPRSYWTRREIAGWLRDLFVTDDLGRGPGSAPDVSVDGADGDVEADGTERDAPDPVIVGIDHGFSFPRAYFDAHGLPLDWDVFLDDFAEHWPTDAPYTYVDFVRDGASGNGAARQGKTRWRRRCEVRAGTAKSVFHFDVPGSVAKSTHAGLPFLRAVRRAAGARLHAWPFDGWVVPPGRSVVAEVYPSLWSRSYPREGRTGDQQDAYAVAAWMRDRDADGTLGDSLEPALSEADRDAACYEGWILGVR